MKSEEIILTICIPTYNRMLFLKKQLDFFYKQLENKPNIQNQVKFIVSDNASTDNTLSMLETWDKKSLFFDHYSNEENYGLVGNIKVSLNRSTTEYVWFVSDDDELKEGIIEKVLDVLNNDFPEFLFINYSNGNTRKIGYTGLGGLILDSKTTALNIYNESYGSLVFMTSCVYKRKNILELNNDSMSSWISVPLLYSFYSCAKGPMYIIKEPMVIFNPGNASYAGTKRVLKIKFEEYIKVLEKLEAFGYNRKEVLKTIKTFLKKQSHSHFLYNFVNPRNSVRLYKYYNLSTIVNFPVNIINYIFQK